jgi:hypothetical protein
MSDDLHYGDDDDVYAVELHDTVEVRVDGQTHEGEVTRIWPRCREVRVSYADGYDTARTTGRPRRRSVRVPVAAVTLIARDC